MITTSDRPRTALSDDWWGDLDASVLDCLAGRGAASPEEIARAVGLSTGSVASVLLMLAREGKVRITRVEAMGCQRVAAA